MRLELGKRVRCADEASRELADVVIDAASNSVTHLVVQPHDEGDDARLVPIQLAQDGEGGEISLSCTAEMLREFEPVRAHAFLRAGERLEDDSKWDVGVEDMQPVPQYAPSAFGEFGTDLGSDIAITYDRVPKGEVELRHASAIYSADRHHIGSVDGVVVDAGTRITHLLLQRGHLWWKRELAIPAEAISKFENDMVVLGINKRELS